MNVIYKDGNLVIDLHDLLNSIPDKELSGFYEDVSCNNVVIEHVTEQIINKWTENFYSGSACVIASEEPTYGLDKAWRRVAKHSSDVAKREIERLENALKSSKEQIQELYKRIDSYEHRNDY